MTTETPIRPIKKRQILEQEIAKPSKSKERKAQIEQELAILGVRLDTLANSCPTVKAFIALSKQVDALNAALQDLSDLENEALASAKKQLEEVK